MLDENISITDNAQEISNGATMLTAVAALESLLKDLAPDGEVSRGGLHQHVKEFLDQHDALPEERVAIMAMVSKVSKRRNTFAHTLTGSYWTTEEQEFAFDPATMQDTLFMVGEIAIALEKMMDN